MRSDALRPFVRVPIILAALVLLCVVLILVLAYRASIASAADPWLLIWAAIPAAVSGALAPLNLIAGGYYFSKYRDDPVGFKIFVGVGVVASLALLAVAATGR
jgi:hypothetical protein